MRWDHGYEASTSRGGWSRLRHSFRWYSLCVPMKGWPGWVGLSGWLHTKMDYLLWWRSPILVLTWPDVGFTFITGPPVVVCDAAGVRAGRAPTLHGGPVRLRPVRATPCLLSRYVSLARPHSTNRNCWHTADYSMHVCVLARIQFCVPAMPLTALNHFKVHSPAHGRPLWTINSPNRVCHCGPQNSRGCTGPENKTEMSENRAVKSWKLCEVCGWVSAIACLSSITQGLNSFWSGVGP